MPRGEDTQLEFPSKICEPRITCTQLGCCETLNTSRIDCSPYIVLSILWWGILREVVQTSAARLTWEATALRVSSRSMRLNAMLCWKPLVTGTLPCFTIAQAAYATFKIALEGSLKTKHSETPPGENQNLFATLTVRTYVWIVPNWTLQQSMAKSTGRRV